MADLTPLCPSRIKHRLVHTQGAVLTLFLVSFTFSAIFSTLGDMCCIVTSPRMIKSRRFRSPVDPSTVVRGTQYMAVDISSKSPEVLTINTTAIFIDPILDSNRSRVGCASACFQQTRISSTSFKNRLLPRWSERQHRTPVRR